jgi:hypothetical protein
MLDNTNILDYCSIPKLQIHNVSIVQRPLALSVYDTTLKRFVRANTLAYFAAESV